MDNSTPTYGHELAIFLEILDPVRIGFFLPANNFIGGQILSELLNSKLSAAGQLMQPMLLSGPLNQICGRGHVRDASESSRIIRATLEKVTLEKFAKIYRFDTDELIYRCLFPERRRGCQWRGG